MVKNNEGMFFTGKLNMSNPDVSEKTAEIKQDWLFEIGDRNNFYFAQFIRELFETNAARNGFARRLLCLKRDDAMEGDVVLNFKRDSIMSRADEMKEQMHKASTDHYVREDRSLFEKIRANLPPSQIMERSWSDFSMKLVAEARSMITDHNSPVSSFVFSSEFWNRFLASEDFLSMIDPVTHHEKLLQGFLGTMFGVNLQSDAFRHPAHKFIERGEMFIFSDTHNVGEMSIYGIPEKDQFDVGMLIEGGDEIDWHFPHDFYFNRIDYTKIALLRMK